MSRFDPARAAFAELRAALETDDALRADVLGCLNLLLTRYNTQIYENRFIVGGVTERIIGAAFVALGKARKLAGVHVTRHDICVGGVNLSVKGSFRPKPATIRLVNVMGDSAGAEWQEPTIFVISKVGIGYADPLLLPSKTQRAKDAILLPYRELHALWARAPGLIFPADLPYSRDDMEGSDIASRIVADEILRYAKRLRPFDRRTHEE